MADNVSITPGTGATVAADQLATGEYVQYVKLMDGTSDGTSKAAITSNGLAVDPGVTSIGNDRVTVSTAGNRVQFPTHPCKWVIISGDENNTGSVVYGGSTVVATAASRSGVCLQALEVTPKIYCSNTNLFYLDSVVSGEGASFVFGL